MRESPACTQWHTESGVSKNAASVLCGSCSAEAAVSLAPQQVLLDLHMPGLSGLQVLDELRQLRLDCQVVVLTALLMSNSR